MQLIHHSPLGALLIPEVLGEVDPGVPFGVPDDIARSLLRQSDVFQVAEMPTTLAGLKALADAVDVDITGLKTKADIAAAIANPDSTQEAQA